MTREELQESARGWLSVGVVFLVARGRRVDRGRGGPCSDRGDRDRGNPRHHHDRGHEYWGRHRDRRSGARRFTRHGAAVLHPGAPHARRRGIATGPIEKGVVGRRSAFLPLGSGIRLGGGNCPETKGGAKAAMRASCGQELRGPVRSAPSPCRGLFAVRTRIRRTDRPTSGAEELDVVLKPQRGDVRCKRDSLIEVVRRTSQARTQVMM